MQVEKANKICQQLETIQKLDFTKEDDSKLHPIKKIYKQILKDILKSPEENVAEICQLIKDNKLLNIKKFYVTVYRMLKSEQLTKEGVEQIVKTIKEHYQID
jgi:vacuolar-type H+-ATPase catalytic subunit A/Vma1